MGTYLTKGTTFTTGDTVTAGALNNLVDNATVTAGSIGSAELAANSVVNGKIIDSATGAEPVTTGTIRANAISNAKLAQMAAKTVKANATNGAADPTDVPVAVSELLAGTTTTINAVSFTTDLEMVDSSDAIKTDNTAAKIRVSANLIGGKVSVTADELDEILIKDATDGALKRATVKTAVQSQVATTVATGVCELATAAKLIDSSGAAANDVISAATGSPMLTKAWVEFTSTGIVVIKINNGAGYAIGDYTTAGMTVDALGGAEFSGLLSSGQILLFSGGGSFLLSADAVTTDTEIYGTLSGALVADNETVSEFSETITNSFNITSITRTAQGIFDILFTTDLPSNKYIAAITGYNFYHNDILSGNITSRTVAVGEGCTVKFGHYDNAATAFFDPNGNATLIFYGLTS